MRTIVIFVYVITLIPALALLAGCAGGTVVLDTPEHDALLVAARAAIDIEPAAGENYHLSLQEALDRGVQANLDAHVAALEALVQQDRVTLEKFKALPSVRASAGYQGRSNDGGTSSRSVLTGQQSLEPSQSSQEDRRVADLKISWNVLDAVLALVDAKTASDEAVISLERQKKVIQNIERDVYSAYWRAAAHQKTRDETQRLVKEAQAQVVAINQAAKEKLISQGEAAEKVSQISERLRGLKELQNQIALSEIELKSLLSIPFKTQLILDENDTQYGSRYKAILAQDPENLEDRALKNRPEMREAVVKKNISSRDVRREVISTFPGAEFLLALNYDSNMFLEDKTWANTSFSLAQSVIDFLTLPSRYEKAQRRELLEDARRQALAAAILAQTHIAHHRLVMADRDYIDAAQAYDVLARAGQAKRQGHDVGFDSGETALLASLTAQTQLLREKIAYAELQDSYSYFMNTLGTPISVDRGV
jgi:multidrug efflux system outer membrane protein